MFSRQTDSDSARANTPLGNGGVVAPPTSVHGEDNIGLYELLLDELGAKCAREVREFARESSRYGEDSYSYKMNLLLVAFLRLGSRMPRDFADAINRANTVFDANMRERLDEFSKRFEGSFNQFKPIATRQSLPIIGLRRPGFCLISKLNAVLGNDRLFRTCDFAFRHIWILICTICILTAFTMWRVAIGFAAAQLKEWERSETVEYERREKQDRFDVEKQSDENLKLRFQNLEPPTYRIAQQIERSSRRVVMSDGTPAWEIRLTKSAGYLSSTIDFDHPPYSDLLVYVKNEPERMLLTDTSPPTAGNIKNGKTAAQNKLPQRH